MFFKKFRSHSKSSSKSDKPSIGRITSASSSHNVTFSKIPVMAVSTVSGGMDKDAEEAKEYKVFLEKARKAAEKEEKDRLKAIKRSKEANMSPWASRM